MNSIGIILSTQDEDIQKLKKEFLNEVLKLTESRPIHVEAFEWDLESEPKEWGEDIKSSYWVTFYDSDDDVE